MEEIPDAEEVPEEEGRARMAKGDGSALLIIPEGFADAVLLEEPTELVLLTNPSQNILPKIIEETLSIVADSVFYLHRLLGDQVRKIAEGPESGNFFPDAVVAVRFQTSEVMTGAAEMLCYGTAVRLGATAA